MAKDGSGKHSQLFMLGLDAASLPFIQDNLSRLPFLAGLLAEGTLRELQSSAGHLSASVWPTFQTGKLPGDHGQYFPFQWQGDQLRYRRVADPAWSGAFDCQPFWHRVALAGRPTIAFDIAHALHDESAPCLQITNWSYQSSGAAKASQPQVLADIRRRFGRRPIGPEIPVPKTARQCAAIRDRLVAAVRAKADATIHLMNAPWDLFVTGWYEVHRAGHNLWPVEGDFGSDASPDAMLAVYEETDRQLARVWRAIEGQGRETALLLFSLHGMEPNRAQDHFLPEILSRLNKIYLGEQPDWSERPKAPNVVATLRRALPPTLQYRVASLLGERVQDWVVNRALIGGRAWEATPSIPVLSGGEGLVRFSIKGREANGFFQPGSRELAGYREWLCTRVGRITISGTGEPLVASIVGVDEHLPGSRRDFLPDLILQWRPQAPASRITSPDIGEIQVSLATGRGGNHNASAFVMARGATAFLDNVDAARHIRDLGGIADAFFAPGARRPDPRNRPTSAE
jgi:hypothetical protein